MNKFVLIWVACLAMVVDAQTVHIAGLDFGIVFDDATLSATNKAIIANDVVRLLAPSTNSVVYAAHAVPQEGDIVGRLKNLQSPFLYPKSEMPVDVKKNATNGLDVVVSKSLSDEYLAAISLMQSRTVAKQQAEEFAAFLVTNKLTNLTAPLANQLFLFKTIPIGTITSTQAIELGGDYANLEFFTPSLLGYQLLNEGPNNASYLWGTIPAAQNDEVTRIPMIYYQNQWRISWWFMESGEQTW